MRIYSTFIIFLLAITSANLLSSQNCLAQESYAFGEIKSSGSVQIGSSTGKWVQIQDIYPLLKNTKIRTNDGIVFITTREGSRIDLSKDTEASIEAMNNNYPVNLVNGTISFNITPSSSLTIVTKNATISVATQVGGYYSLVAGPGAPDLTNIQGMVFSNAQGTYIKSINGRINISGSSLQARVLNTGESLFASADGGDKPLGYNPANPKLSTGAIQALITGAFFTGATITAIEAFRGDGVHSPSGFKKFP